MARYLTVDYSTDPPTILEDFTVTENHDTIQVHEMLSAQHSTKENYMTDEWNVQANIKVGETLINLRGKDAAEIGKHADELKDFLENILEAASIGKQVMMAKGLTSFTPAPSATTPNAQNSAPAASTPATLRCVHGAYKDLLGKKNKQGQLYKNRYACAAPYVPGGNPDQCKDLPGQEVNREV